MGLAGLLHDYDYERYPNPEHSPTEDTPRGSAQLREKGVSDAVCRAILGHGNYTASPRHAHGQGALCRR